MASKKSFVLYTDYLEPLEDLTDEQVGRVFKAIMSYTSGKEMPEMDSACKMAFTFIKQQIDRDLEKWEQVRVKRSEAGAKGAKQKLANASKCQQMLANDSKTKQSLANQAVNVNVNVNDNVNVNNIKEINKEKSEKPKRFIPPSVDEVKKYCFERNNGIDAEAFVAFYDSKNWMVGSNKMKDWKSAIITWEKRRKEEKKNTPVANYRQFEHRNEISDLERELLAN